jgi:hypothetical protein
MSATTSPVIASPNSVRTPAMTLTGGFEIQSYLRDNTRQFKKFVYQVTKDEQK